jgi:hypothetical protein
LRVHKHNPTGGRPKQVAEFIEGKPAASNFVGAMRQILSGQKPATHQIGSGFQKRHRLGK